MSSSSLFSGETTPAPETPLSASSKSVIWQYSRSPSDDRPERCIKGRRIFYCMPCWQSKGRETQYNTSAGTVYIARHLLHEHRIQIAAQRSSKLFDSTQKTLLDQGIWAQSAKLAPRKPTTTFPDFAPDALDPIFLRGLYINLIAAKHLPFALCEASEFRALLHYINPYANKILPVRGTTVWKDLQSDFNDKKVLIRQALQQAISKIHFPSMAGPLRTNMGFLE